MITVLASVRDPIPWSVLKEALTLQDEINECYRAEILAKNIKHLVFNIVSRHGDGSDLEDSISISRRIELWSTHSILFERLMEPAKQRSELKNAAKLAMNALPSIYIGQSEKARFAAVVDAFP